MMKTLTALFAVISLLLTGANIAPAKRYSAKAYVLMEASTGRIILGENENQILPNASTTKIMTAMLALEQESITENFQVDSNAIMVEGTSMGLRKGDNVSLYSLSVGMLLASGNDAANAAAVKVSGSADKFSALMNERAKAIPMKNTNFVTPSGLHNEQHYSTAYDMALLAREAMKNPAFAKICSSQKVTVEFGSPVAKRTYTNHNKMLSVYDGCIGVKTGFTKKAGRCLVSAATRDGVTLICVTLGASDDWNIHKSLFNYGFNQVEVVEIPTKPVPMSVNVVGAEPAKLPIVVEKPAKAPITVEDISRLEEIVLLEKFYYAPIKKGDKVGEVKYYLDGNEVACTKLIADAAS